MKQTARILSMAGLLALCGLAHAEVTPPFGNEDPRVRVVTYQAQNVVELHTFYGVSTHIAFAPGEIVKWEACGDSAAWDIVDKGNNLFIKPKASHADTNLTVITNRRTYNFELEVLPFPPNSSWAWRSKHLIYQLTFLYPDDVVRAKNIELADQAQAAAEAQAAAAAARAKQQIKTDLHEAKNAPSLNYDYWAAGSKSITPVAAYDNGQFIYLKFAPHQAMPSVYDLVSNKGGKDEEALVNTTVQGDTLVVERLVPKLVLRLGQQVVAVENRKFNANGGMPATGTISPKVQRVVIGGEHE